MGAKNKAMKNFINRSKFQLLALIFKSKWIQIQRNADPDPQHCEIVMVMVVQRFTN
jgi:hypothetical protein